MNHSLLPQIASAIAYLQDEVADIRAGKKDSCLKDIVEASPLPKEQFKDLLAVWNAPKIDAEVLTLLAQYEELQNKKNEQVTSKNSEKSVQDDNAATGAQEQERGGLVQSESTGIGSPQTAPVAENLVLERLKATGRRKPRTRPRRRFEDPDEEDVSQSDGGYTPSPKSEYNEGTPSTGAEPSTIITGVKNEEPAIVKTDIESMREKAEINSSERTDASAHDAVTRKGLRPSLSPSPQATLAEENATSIIEEKKEENAGKSISEEENLREKHEDRSSTQEEKDEKNEEANTKDKQHEEALARLRDLRENMMLDVLSKISSVAKTKGVDPAMFSSRETKDGKTTTELVDLDMIATDVSSGIIFEWERFAQRVYLFCQLVIAQAERMGQHDAKQKGLELLHFARTLTETLRKASMKKEESLLQKIEQGGNGGNSSGPATPVASSPAVSRRLSTSSVEAQVSAPSTPGATSAASTTPSAAATEKKTKLPSAPNQNSPKQQRGATEPATPSRASARIRLRGNSDSQSPVLSVPQPSTASEDVSGSESQVSASEETESKPAVTRRSTRGASPSSSSAQTTPTATRSRSRKRRPVLPATRMSSRQQKRRAREAEEAAAAAADESDDNNDDDTAGTAEDDDEDGNTSEARDPSPPPAPPAQLTKAGRPRKKPGRKPAGWKKSEGK